MNITMTKTVSISYVFAMVTDGCVHFDWLVNNNMTNARVLFKRRR